MLTEFRTTDLIWDKANRKFYDNIEANESDQNGRRLTVQVLNQSVIEDLTNATLSLYWKSLNGNKGLDAFTAIDASKGLFEVHYTTGMLSNSGKLKAHLVLVDVEGRIISHEFTITVSKGIDDSAIESSDSFTALTTALATVNEYDKKIEDFKAETNAQLAHNTKQLGYTDKWENVKAWGAKANANFYNENDGNYYADASFTELSNDDTKAINDALLTGRNIRIPEGNYLITSPILSNKNDQKISGDGRDKTFIFCQGAINGIEKTENEIVRHITIEGLTINSDPTNKGEHGIKVINASRLTVRHVIINDFITGITEWAWVSELEHMYIGNTNTGFRILGGTSTTFKQCYANTSTNGFILGDLENEFGYGQLVLQYASFLNSASDHADEWAYKILGAQAVSFINCGSEYSGIGAYYIGDGKNSLGEQVAFSSVVIDNPFSLLNDAEVPLATDCFLKNAGRNNVIEIRGLADGAIRGTFNKLIDDIENSSSPVVIKHSNYPFKQNAATGGFAFEKGHLWGARSESRQSLPILSNTSKIINATNLAHKTAGNEMELFIFAPNDGDIATGHIDFYPLKWSDTVVPNPNRVTFFAQNVAGTLKAKINLPDDVVTSTNVQATSAGLTVFRLWLRFSSTANAADPYMTFVEAFSDQNSISQRTIVIK